MGTTAEKEAKFLIVHHHELEPDQVIEQLTTEYDLSGMVDAKFEVEAQEGRCFQIGGNVMAVHKI